jgi:hypothetical protein
LGDLKTVKAYNSDHSVFLEFILRLTVQGNLNPNDNSEHLVFYNLSWVNNEDFTNRLTQVYIILQINVQFAYL